jgi:hypothetical protein
MVYVHIYFIYILLLQKTAKHFLIPRLGVYIFLYTTVRNELKYLFFVRDRFAFPDSITTVVVAALNKNKKTQ